MAPARVWIIAALVLAGAMGVAVFVGPAGLPPKGVLLSMIDHLPFVRVHSGLSPVESAILLQIRMPRIVLGAIVGWMLAAMNSRSGRYSSFWPRFCAASASHASSRIHDRMGFAG